MRNKTKVLITFLSHTNNETTLIENIDQKFPQYRDLLIILVVNKEVAYCNKISHPRIKATICSERFISKKGVEYILIDNNPKESCCVVSRFAKNNTAPIAVHKLEN